MKINNNIIAESPVADSAGTRGTGRRRIAIISTDKKDTSFHDEK